MKTADAQINLSIDVDCPHCDESINLMEIEGMYDDGFIYNKCLPDGKSWGCKDFNQKIECPECKSEFIIQEVIY